jgi:flagellar biosynthesis/type III secretory pathway protein FliH
MFDVAARPVSLIDATARRSPFKPLLSATISPAQTDTALDEYARGLADGQNMVGAAFALERAALQNLVASAEALQPDAGPELSLLIRETVVRLVSQIADSVLIDTKHLEQQVERATSIMTEADEARQIMLHPEDAKLIGSTVNGLVVRSDPELSRGAIRIECSQGWIEHGVALGLERLRECLHYEASVI